VIIWLSFSYINVHFLLRKLCLCFVCYPPLVRNVRHYKWQCRYNYNSYWQQSIHLCELLILVIWLKNVIIWKINALLALVNAINFQPYFKYKFHVQVVFDIFVMRDRFVTYCVIQLFACTRLKYLFSVHFGRCLVTRQLQTRFNFFSRALLSHFFCAVV